MNWSFIANLKLIWCVMNPLCWLANVLMLTAAVKCVCACVSILMWNFVASICLCVSVCVSVGMTVALLCVCVGEGCAAAHRWVGYAEWAQRGWLRYKPYHPIVSLLTINLNRLKNRVTTNQPGSLRKRLYFVIVAVCIAWLHFFCALLLHFPIFIIIWNHIPWTCPHNAQSMEMFYF